MVPGPGSCMPMTAEISPAESIPWAIRPPNRVVLAYSSLIWASHVLLAIGLPHAIAHGSVRLSLGDDITEDEVDTIIQDLTEVVNDLRVLSPVWDVAAQRPAW